LVIQAHPEVLSEGVILDELFSCRNCVNDCGQSLLIGRGAGFCIRHNSVLIKPGQTTCKYLHRKDLPRFVVDEGISEHAAEFASYPGMVDLIARTRIQITYYSEKFAWERREFDPINQSLAQYHKAKPAWVFMQAMSGGSDGRRALAQASLVRRYMDNCGSWRSSYRFVLAMIQGISSKLFFEDRDLNSESTLNAGELTTEAVWDVFFTRLSGIQEYGFHAGIEELMWATDHLGESVSNLDWPTLSKSLVQQEPEWTNLVIRHATNEGAFFPDPRHFEEGEGEQES